MIKGDTLGTAPTATVPLLYFAPAGWGKTHSLLVELKDHLLSLEGADIFKPRKLIITPYAEQARRLKSLLLEILPEGLLFAKPIISYRDFTRMLLPETGEISEIQKRRLLEDIVKRSEFKYYKEASQNPGFIHCVSSFVSEWKMLGLQADDWEMSLALFKGEPVLGEKLKELLEVCRAYSGKAEALGFRDFDDAFLERIKEGSPAFSVLEGLEGIFFDGFYDFSHAQLLFLKRLAGEVSDVRVYLTHEEGRRKALFYLTHETIRKLESIGFSKKALQVPGKGKTPPKNFRTHSKNLIHLERNLFAERETFKPLPTPTEIRIFEGVGMQGEVNWIARKILQEMRRRKTLRWCDIAIFFRELNPYIPYLSEIFSEFNIPLEIHERLKLRENPWVRHVLTGFRILKTGPKDPKLFFDFLRSSYLPLTAGLASDFEHFVLSRPEFDPKDFDCMGLAALWHSQTEDKDAAYVLLEFLHNFEILEEAFETKFSGVLFEKALKDSLKQWGNFELEKGEGSRHDFAAHQSLEKILEEIRINESNFWKEPSFADYLDAFEKGIQLSLFSVHTALPDAVQIYSVPLSRQKEFQIVFIGGLLQKNFPESVREDEVLKDNERRILSSLGFRERLPMREHERYYFYLAATRAIEMLYLTYPRYDLEGNESLPSFFVEEVKKLFQPSRSKKLSDVNSEAISTTRESRSVSIPHAEEAVSLRDFQNLLCYELSARFPARHLSHRRKEVLPLFHLLRSHRSLPNVTIPPSNYRWDVYLSEKIRNNFLEKKAFSPTALESYGSCPFRYFAEKILGLKERLDLEAVTPLVEGTLYHDVLATLMEKALSGKFSGTELRNEAQTILEKHPDFSSLRLPVYEKELFCDGFLDVVQRVLSREKERLQESEFQPKFYELPFGAQRGDENPVEPVFLREGLYLSGRMDRVDVNEKSRQAKLIDYKTGKSRKLPVKDIESGKHLQLPLYGAVLKQVFNYEPVSYLIYSIKKAEPSEITCLADGSKKKILTKEEFAALEEDTLNYSASYTASIRKADFPVIPKECPTYCPFPGLCRFELWRRTYLEEEGMVEKDV